MARPRPRGKYTSRCQPAARTAAPRQRGRLLLGRLLLGRLLLGGLLLAGPEASAYLSDHGFLGERNVCDDHVPVKLRVPENAQPVPNPLFGEYSGGFFHVEELADGLFYATEGAHQLMFLVDDAGIIVVDAPPSIGLNLQDPAASVSLLDVIYSIPETQGKPIRKLIYSHAHIDHIGAASFIVDAFPEVEIIGHVETREQLARGTGRFGAFVGGAGRLPPPLPDVTFKQHKRVRLGSQRLELRYHGPIHAPGNIVIHAPDQRVLMLVDAIAPGSANFRQLGLASDVPLVFEAHDLALEFDFESFVGGHINRLGTRADVEESRAYIEDMRANAITALRDPSLLAIFGVVVPPNPPFQPFPAPLGVANPLGAIDVFLDQVACRCANLTLDPAATPSGTAWLERLGAADVMSVKHCFRITEALRDDPSF